jgi:hypothetical protein
MLYHPLMHVRQMHAYVFLNGIISFPELEYLLITTDVAASQTQQSL